MAFFTTPIQPLHYPSLNFLCMILTLHLLNILCTATTHDLIPIDSPLSPFYNPSNTHYDRLHNSFTRSINRVNNHFRSSSKLEAPMKQGGGEYLMKMSLGTPPIEVVGIVDTGSDLIWTQCLPCTSCYNQTIPLFDPTNSSSYKNIPCGSTPCGELAKPICNEIDFTCEYNFSYGDGSHSIGNLASETLTLVGTNGNNINNSIMSLPNVLFGCGHDTGGTFDSSGSGIIGLGSGNLSLISQLGDKKNHLFSFGSKAFSYCLVPSSINSTSKISFGNDAVVSGDGIVTTPIVTKTPETFYYLTLEGISVGTERFAYPNNNVHDVGVVEGNIIIDSGTTLTLVPEQIFNDLVLGLDRVIRLEKVRDPNGLLSVCYKSNVGVGGDNVKLPIITVHFKGGDVRLKPVNTFSWVNDDVFCFTMIASGDYAIYGNLAQMNFLVGFDLDAGTVSFKPTECIKEYL